MNHENVLKMLRYFILPILLIVLSCSTLDKENAEQPETVEITSDIEVDRFADIRVLRYELPNFDKLTLSQKKLVYFLTEAGLAGRDIMYEMNYRHNLEIRKAIDQIIEDYDGDRTTMEWDAFLTYAKRVWFANGIHHHYGMDKFIPDFDQAYLESLLAETKQKISDEAIRAIFDPTFDAKKVSLDAEKDLLLSSAVNFYDPDISTQEASEFYAPYDAAETITPLSHGLNSKLIRTQDGNLNELVYYKDGLYGEAIKAMIPWLEKATTVAENSAQRHALELLIEYYNTGDLKVWDDYCIAWVEAIEGDIDYIHGFVEVYNDPLGRKGSYESIVEINDFEASARMKVLQDHAQWFEDNSTILPKHKKEKVVGVTYKVVNVAGESGDASPSTPIGVNLPNANWIRAMHGSKSVSLGNIKDAHDQASGSGMTAEFAHDAEEIDRAAEYGKLASNLSTALHEVIGHASGQINPGVGTPKETLKNYASTIEEARADIVGLYFIMDPKLIEMGLIPNLDVGKAAYDSYISNGLLKQLRRLEIRKNIEESHMRNRQTIAAWVFEKGAPDQVIKKVIRDNKTYFDITDYEKLRTLFGELLKELQRITSEGDFEAAQALVEGYGVKVDPDIHKEVLERTKILDIPAYSGFVNPILVPTTDDEGNIMDVEVKYAQDFISQMLTYGKRYSFL